MISIDHYEYTKLDLQASNIRLVEILSTSVGSEIHCRIHTKPLDQELQYVALSYTWGRPPADSIVYLDGRRLGIRKSLWRFLSTKASKPNSGELYWIDAICINQQDDLERTHQVQLMSQIYSNAARVDVWLGPAYNNSNTAMQTIAKGTAYERAKGRISKFWEKPAGIAIRQICHRPYWTRLWIFQELMLAKKLTLICGATEIPGDSFRDFMLDVRAGSPNYEVKFSSVLTDDTKETIWSQLPELPHETAADNADSLRELGIGHKDILESGALKVIVQLGQTQNQSSLLDLMEKTCHLRCSDPRDKVFALLGIAKVGHEQIRPDYKTSVSKLLNDVLRHVHQIQQPVNIKEVEQQCRRLSDMLGTNVETMFLPEGGSAHTTMPEDAIKHEFPLGQDGSNITLWWTEAHGHKAVEELCLCSAFDNETLICQAASSGSTRVVKRLLDVGIRSDLALEMASSEGHTEVVQLLLEYGADPGADVGPLSHVIYGLCDAFKQGNKEVLQLPVEEGANVKASKVSRSCNALENASRKGHKDIVQLLLDNGANVNAVNRSGSPALLIASRQGHLETVELLLDKGADIDAFGSWYCSALCVASRAGHQEIVQLLLASGARVPARSENHLQDPVYAAASSGHKEVVQLLLDNGNVDTRGWSYRNAVAAAIRGCRTDIVQLLLAQGAYTKAVISRCGKYLDLT